MTGPVRSLSSPEATGAVARRDQSAVAGVRFGVALAVIAAAGFAVRVVYAFVVDPALGFDAIWYVLQAGTIAEGVGYVDPAPFYEQGVETATANFPPLWPGLLALVNVIGIADTERAYQVVGAGLGAGTVVVTGLLGRRIAGEPVGLVAALLVALSPSLVAADGSLMAESLLVLLVGVALLLGDRILRGGGTGAWVALGLVLGLAVLSHSAALVLAPVLVGVLVWRQPTARPSRRVGYGTLALAVAALIFLPWALRSGDALGEPVALSSNSASLLEGANCESAYGGELIGSWDPACLRHTRAPGLSESEWSERARDAGVRYARSHATRVPLVGGVRAFRAWGLYDPIDGARAEAVETRNADWQVGAWAVSLALLAAAIVGAVALTRRGDVPVLLLAVIAAATLLCVVSWGNSRFRLAADPAVAVLAAAGLVVAWERARRRGRPRGGAPSRRPGTEGPHR